MNKDKGPLSWIGKLFSKEEQPEKKAGKYQYLVVVLLFGALIMLISNFFFKDNNGNSSLPVIGKSTTKEESVETFGGKKSSESDLITNYEKYYESQLKEALEEIAGVSDVSVVVNVDATEKKILEKNKVTKSQKTKEVDREGGERDVDDQSQDEQVVIIQEGEKEVPIVLETKKPEIRGVLIVAKGADNIQIEKWIKESVTRLLDVPSHRVSVMPKK
jgi:stage III sporulation protein AG